MYKGEIEVEQEKKKIKIKSELLGFEPVTFELC